MAQANPGNVAELTAAATAVRRAAGRVQFADIGVPQEKVGQFFFDAATTGKIGGYQGNGTGRPIFEFLFEGRPYRVAVTVGDKGFIVGANPVGR